MTTYTITLGLESPCLSVDEARDAALEIVGFHFPDGHTVIDATGRWMSPERGVINEPSLMVIVAGNGEDTRRAVSLACSQYKNVAQQDSVMLQVTHPQTFFI